MIECFDSSSNFRPDFLQKRVIFIWQDQTEITKFRLREERIGRKIIKYWNFESVGGRSAEKIADDREREDHGNQSLGFGSDKTCAREKTMRPRDTEGGESLG